MPAGKVMNVLLKPLTLIFSSALPCLLALLLTVSDSTLYTTDGSVLHTIRGHVVPSALVRQAVPHVEASELAHALFEHEQGGTTLISLRKRIDIGKLAPHAVVPQMRISRIVVDGVRQAAPSQGPLIRHGSHYSFVFDARSGVLLAAWGPGLDLRPLHLRAHPGVLVNRAHGRPTTAAHLHILPSAHTPSVTQAEPTSSQEYGRPDYGSEKQHVRLPSAVSQFRPTWKSELQIFFDVGFGFDATFCAQFQGDVANATLVVHALGVEAHRMALGPIVNVRISDIVGHCNTSTDTFRKPIAVTLCPISSTKCSRPSLILRSFREAWQRTEDATGVVDAAYLVTGYGVGTSIVGAAWVASACHPRYKYGWAQDVHPVVLAHELAHTLGAPHDAAGLMQPELNLNEPEKLSFPSLQNIQNYIQKIKAAECLASRNEWSPGGRRHYSAFTKIGPRSSVIGTDVAFGRISPDGRQADVIMLYVVKYGNGPIHGLHLGTSRVFRQSSEKQFPFSFDNWNFVHERVNLEKGNYSTGGGLAVGRLRNKHQLDVIVFSILNTTMGRYIIGYGYNATVKIRNHWSSPMTVRKPLGHDVRCVGAAIGGIRKTGGNDLVVVYVDFRNGVFVPFYIVGFGLAANGYATGGWSDPIRLPWSTKTEVGDISVAFHDTTGNGALDMVVSYSSIENGLWNLNFYVGSMINSYGIVSGSWKPIKPDLSFKPSADIVKLTGGIDLTSTGPAGSTAVLYQSRQLKQEHSLWLEIGDDVLSEHKIEPPILANTDIHTPLQTCKACYPDKYATKLCKRRIHSCFAKSSLFALSTVSAKRPQSGATRIMDAAAGRILNNQGSGSIFCAGFHQLYMANVEGCRWDAQPEDIMSAGSMSAFLSDLNDSEANPSLRALYNMTFGKVPSHFRYINPGGAVGPNRVPKAINIIFRSDRLVRWKIIRAALIKFKSRPDFRGTFKGANVRYTVKRKGQYKFVVIVSFADRYRKEFLKRNTKDYSAR